MLQEVLSRTPDSHLSTVLSRPAGSQWSGDADLIRSAIERAMVFEPAEEFRHPAGICRYFRVPLGGEEGILIAGQDDLSTLSIRIRTGAHGNAELVAEGVGSHTVDHGIAITGPGDDLDVDGEILWTAYPGRLTRMVDLSSLLEEYGEDGVVPADQIPVDATIKGL